MNSPALVTREEDGLDEPTWRALQNDPQVTFFHTPAWLDALVDVYPYYRLRWIVARDGDGRPVGGLPIIASRRTAAVQRLSLPYGTYGGPLTLAPDPARRAAIRAALLTAWWESADRLTVARAQLALFAPPGGEGFPDWPGAGSTRAERTHLTDLSIGFDRLWSAVFDGDVRTGCRRAEKLGVVVHEAPDDAGTGELDSLYRAQAAGWNNHTPFPPGLFEGMRSRGRDTVGIWLARHEGRAVAGLLAVHGGGGAMAWLAPSTPDARRLNAMPLLYRYVMEAAIARGDRFFNFGGSRQATGLESFKEGLGGRPHEYPVCLREAGWFGPLRRLQYRIRGLRNTEAPVGGGAA